MDLRKFSKTPNAITNIFQQNESNPIALNNFSQKPANHPYTLGAIALIGTDGIVYWTQPDGLPKVSEW